MAMSMVTYGLYDVIQLISNNPVGNYHVHLHSQVAGLVSIQNYGGLKGKCQVDGVLSPKISEIFNRAYSAGFK